MDNDDEQVDLLGEAKNDVVEKISIAGWKEALSERVLWIRYCFIVALIILSAFCLYYSYSGISLNLEKEKYDDEITDILHVDSLPFSNVTICAQLYFNKTFVKENLTIPLKAFNIYHKFTNQSMEKFYERLALFLTMIFRPYKYTIMNRLAFSKVLRANPQTVDYSNFASRAFIQCEMFFKSCRFAGKEFDCCSRAVQVFDDDGICYLLTVSRISVDMSSDIHIYI
jgi:hypothetical protein